MAADYRVKYIDLRSKLVESTDVAYRLGYEEGLKKGQEQAQQQMEQQQAEMEQQQMMAQQGMEGQEGQMPQGMEGQEGQEGQMPQGMEGQESQMPQGQEEFEGSEIDQHINELESLVAKGEKPKVTDIRKAVLALAGLRKSQKIKASELKATASSQRNIVKNILKSFEKETKEEYQGLEDIIKEHNK